jgi:hypothetical protein
MVGSRVPTVSAVKNYTEVQTLLGSAFAFASAELKADVAVAVVVESLQA